MSRRSFTPDDKPDRTADKLAARIRAGITDARFDRFVWQPGDLIYEPPERDEHDTPAARARTREWMRRDKDLDPS